MEGTKCYCCGEEAKVGLLLGEDQKPTPLCLDCFSEHVKGNSLVRKSLLYYHELQELKNIAS